MRDNVRYISVAIGIGSYQPHPADEIFENRYGDCKDMSTLLCAMGRAVDLDVRPVLISTWQNGVADTSLPSPYQFNHMIAYAPHVGERGIWMDATAKGCPFGAAPWYAQGMPVLVIDGNGETDIFEIPRTPPSANHVIYDWSIDLHKDGSAHVNGSTQLWGALAVELREDIEFASTNRRIQWLNNYLTERSPGAVLDTFNISGLKPVQDPLIISYSFFSPTFAVLQDSNLAFQPGAIIHFDFPDYFRSPKRVHPVNYKYGMLEEMYVSIYLPDGRTMYSQDYSDSLSTEFGTASWRHIATKQNILRAHEHHLIHGKTVEPEDYTRFQAFIDQIRKRNLRTIVVGKK